MSLPRIRARAQLLHRPRRRSPSEVVRHLLAVQAQDLRSTRLALRARTTGLKRADVDRALTQDRSLVVAWLCRGTLHLVCAEDYPWLLGLTGPARRTANHRRLGRLGVSPGEADRALVVIERALTEEGPLLRAEIADRLATRGIRAEGQTVPHLLMLAALRGIAVLGPIREGRQAIVLTRDWLGVPPPTPLEGDRRDAALAELARRYLTAHPTADYRDLARWSGLPLRDARPEIGGRSDDASGERGGPVPPRLLPAFDPYLLGWRDRSFAVEPQYARRVHPGGGMLRAVATVDGRVVGTWSARGIEALEPIEDADLAALERDRAEAEAF